MFGGIHQGIHLGLVLSILEGYYYLLHFLIGPDHSNNLFSFV